MGSSTHVFSCLLKVLDIATLRICSEWVYANEYAISCHTMPYQFA